MVYAVTAIASTGQILRTKNFVVKCGRKRGCRSMSNFVDNNPGITFTIIICIYYLLSKIIDKI